MDDTPIQQFSSPSYVERSSGKSRLLLTFTLLFLLVIAILAGFYFFMVKGNNSFAPLSSTTPTKAVTATAIPSASVSGAVTPSPSGEAALDRTALRIAVLNGSGISGAARGTSSYLSGLGYIVQTTGNADAFTYQDITVRVSTGKKAYLPQLKKDLEASPSKPTVTASISDDVTADAEVIVGQ